jgi:hypothetical protein
MMLFSQSRLNTAFGIAALAASLAVPALADPAATDAPQAAAVQTDAPLPAVPPNPPQTNAISDYFAHWFDRVNQAQASQPHWMTPLVTVTPRLEEEVRTDFYAEKLGTGATVDSYGNGKGLELIPTTTNEIIINAPTYVERYGVKPASGFGDWPFILVKQRLFSANEQSGNYIVTAFLSVQAPIGVEAFTNHSFVITPTIAGGKGWGDFDVQATLGINLPTAYEYNLGTSVVGNVAFQYHFLKYFWPEVEANWTYWADGMRSGKNQVFITPGIIFGRFNISGRVNAIVGFGYQTAVSPKLTKDPVLTPLYNHAWLATGRITF